MDEKKKKRIGTFMAGLLLGMAGLFDLLELLLEPTIVLPILVGILAAIVFAIWFSFLGVDYFAGKRAGLKLLALFAPIIVSFIPIINAIPDVLTGVGVTILLTYAEDNDIPLPTDNPKKIAADLRKLKQERVANQRIAAQQQQQQRQAAALPPEEDVA